MLPLGFLLLFRVLDVPTTRNASRSSASSTAAIALGALYYGVALRRLRRRTSCSDISVAALPAEARPVARRSRSRRRSRACSWRRSRSGTLRLQSPAGLRTTLRARVGTQGGRPLHARAAQLPVRLDGAHRHRARRRAHALPRLRRDGPRCRRARRRAPPSRGDGRGATTCSERRQSPIEARRHRELRLLAARRSGFARARDRARGLRGDDALRAAARSRAGLRRHPSRRRASQSSRGSLVAVLAGVGFAVADATASTCVARRASPSLVGVLILVELAAPSSPRPISTSDATLDVYRALDDRGTEAVVELPMIQPPHRRRPSSGPQSKRPRMLFATIDWHPRVNGYSGYLPPGYPEDVQLLNTFPSPESLAAAAGARRAVRRAAPRRETSTRRNSSLTSSPSSRRERPHVPTGTRGSST